MSPDAQQLALFDELSYYEGADVEYKSARGGLPGSLWETYSAFANTAGGSIWLGVVQRDNSHLDVQGVPNVEKLRSDLWNLLNNREKVSRNLLVESDVRVVPLPEGRGALLCVRVPQAGRRDRPVYVGKDPFTGTFRRNHEGDYRCTEDEVRRMFADQSDEPADSRVLEGFELADLHPESLAQFRNRFSSFDPANPWLAEDDRGLLAKMGGWRRDRQSGREGITLAGLLMFGREQAIRDPSAVPGFHLDYREHFSGDASVRWTDRLTLDGRWEGNLFQFYQQIVLKLSAGPGITTPFQINAEGYRRTTTSVHEALQEALVNALIHADYRGQGGIVIDRYLDHLEFSNPGTLLVSREQLLRGGVSECRNKALQVMFQKLGAGDKAGSGLDRIRASWAAAHWQSPRLIQTWRPDRVQLVLPMISTLPDDAVRALEGRFGPGFRERSPDEIQALVAAEVEGEITNQRLQEMLALHRVDITRMLRGLVLAGFLVSEGQGRGTRYILAMGAGSSPDSGSGSRDLRPSSPDLPPSLPDLGVSLPDLPPSLPDLGGNLPDSDPANDPQLMNLAAPVRNSGAASKETVEATILGLCSGRFLTLRELASLLNRTQKNLRDEFVPRMVREGQLVQLHPERPSHPKQAYRTRT